MNKCNYCEPRKACEQLDKKREITNEEGIQYLSPVSVIECYEIAIGIGKKLKELENKNK